MRWKAEQERLSNEENEKIVRYIQQDDEKQQQIREHLTRKRDVQSNQQQMMCDRLNEIEVSVAIIQFKKIVLSLRISLSSSLCTALGM